MHVGEIVKEVKNDIKAARKIRPPRWGLLLAGACLVPLMLLLDHVGKLELSLPIYNGALVLGVAVTVKWDLRDRAWFWIVMAIMAAVVAMLILVIPWSGRWVPALAIGGMDSIGVVLILALLAFVKNIAQEGTRGPRKGH